MKWKAVLVGVILLAGAALVAALLPLVRCPGCDDRGRVTGVNRLLRPPLDPLLKDLMGVTWSTEDRFAEFELLRSRLAIRSGLGREDLISPEGRRTPISSCSSAFVRGEGKPYLVITYCSMTDPRPTWILLVDLQGRTLDKVVLSELGTDSRSLAIPYRAHHQGRLTLIRDVEGEWPVDAPTRGVLRLGIREGKFRILSPPKAASP